MFVVGVDENGMGPRLGPLIATAVVVEVDGYDRARLRRNGKRAAIGDSKQTTAFGHMRHAESLALALVERLSGSPPKDADRLLSSLCLDGLMSLRSPCPSGTAAQCWGELPLPAFGGDAVAGHRLIDRMNRWGVRVHRLRSAVACARVLNDEFENDVSKSVIDLGMFERLVVDARSSTAEHDVEALCGMVGGMRKYMEYFRHIGERRIEVVEEKRRSAAYDVGGIGRVRFEVDADDNHFPVGLASMVGKYVRELCMERQNRFYLGHDPELPRPSGYYDPTTTRFIEESEGLRRRLAIAQGCFQRAR